MSDVGPVKSPDVPNYLVWAILSTVFCCLPLGIVSIVFAAQVNGKLAAGDYAGAVSASKNAKLWAWISFGVGLAVIILYVVFIAIMVAVGVSQQRNMPQPVPAQPQPAPAMIVMAGPTIGPRLV